MPYGREAKMESNKIKFYKYMIITSHKEWMKNRVHRYRIMYEPFIAALEDIANKILSINSKLMS